MSTFIVGKSQHNKNDAKNASLAMKSRQQVINEVNKRRTLLQDNSWIKKRPEEEGTNENYGRVVLNQYKSQESLHRNLEEDDDEKAMLNRYRSDTTLDRIPGRSDTNKINTSPILDSRINKRYQDIDDFIKVNHTSKWEEKCRDLESLIAVKDNNSKEGNKDLDDFIIVNCTFEPCDRRSQDLNNLITVNHMSNQLRKDGYQNVEDLIDVSRISNQKGRSSDLDSFIDVKDRNNQRAIIDKELCTYCRKPLGTATKMILEALQICCHATCFKCEICKASLENLEAGDSIWIYKNIVHCSPCYSKVKATWTY
ncbi:sciellin [Pantherophis guttatus]|uniref:Sciellin n=1 Tax=Pantherophis guttatus TaxID=94885 RepID=A0A6P9C1W0_PANGU|nr:sciellin [Pantherophis guttatus]